VLDEKANTRLERKLMSLPQVMARRYRAEREFLPAALEIMEAPVSATGRIMMGLIVVLVVVAIAWACFGKIDIVATANGRLIPAGQIKLIQPLEIGVVKRIMVADGDRVQDGDVLIELDPTTNAADRDRIARDLMQAELDGARLHAVLAGDAGTFLPPSGADPVLADRERQQLIAQLAQHKAKVDGLDRQIATKAAERDYAKATIAKIEASLPLLQEKAGLYDQLRENMLTSKVAWIDARRQLVEAQHDRVVAGHQVDAAEAQTAALTQQRTEADADFRRQALDDLSKTSHYATEQRQELIKAEQRTGFQTLRAPVTGTVEQLTVHTIGGVVTPAQSLMVIVPDGSQLEVEAILPNRDAGFVHAGQPAEVKVEAFNYTRYGVLHGQVRSVSRDALRNELDAPAAETVQGSGKPLSSAVPNSTPANAAYVARISLAEASVETEQGPMPLEPGMTITAEIKTGERHVIVYLLSPFMRYRHEALRER